MATIQPTRTQRPIRFRKARTDGRIASLQAKIASVFGIDPASIAFVLPNGRKMRSDATIRHLRKVWEQHAEKKSRSN